MSALQVALAVLGVGFLIAWHELGHYSAARLLGMRVLRFSIGFGPRLWGFRHKDIDYQLAALPLGGFVQIRGMTSLEPGAVEDPMSFINAARWKRWLVLAAGPGFNYGLAAIMFFAYLWAWPSPVDGPAVELQQVLAGGDVVIAFDGKPLEDGDFRSRILASKGAPVALTVLRGGVEQTFTVTAEKQVGGGYRIGVAPSVLFPRSSLPRTALASLELCRIKTMETLSALGALLRWDKDVKMSSIVAIVDDLKDQADRGLRYFLAMLAWISVVLGLFNLLPIPSLDGIKMLFLTIEGAVRRDIHAGFQVWVNGLGMIALLGLMVILIVRDTWERLAS
jgi:regulator of sigma E protease